MVEVAAQDDEDSEGVVPSYFTWTLDLDACDSPVGTVDWISAYRSTRDMVLSGPDCRIEADDPRASGITYIALNVASYEEDPDAPGIVEVDSFAQRLVNDGGSWSGSGTRASHVHENYWSFATTSLTTLEGDRDYAGLTLILIETSTHGESEWVRQGFIVPSDFVPSTPELPTDQLGF